MPGGEVPERSNGTVSKTVVRVIVSGVRIPLSPPRCMWYVTNVDVGMYSESVISFRSIAYFVCVFCFYESKCVILDLILNFVMCLLHSIFSRYWFP